MGSSKIQEYNLDPNMGLAKESSVQQILSAVGSGVTANVVKSIQHCIYELENVTVQTYSISTVDPEKCIVLFERLYDANESTAKAVYELKADSVTFDCGNFRSNFTIGLWIIELY